MQDSTPEIVTHDLVLRAERQNDGGPGMVINLISPQYGAHAQVTRPLAVEVVDESERSGWINGDYSGVVRQDNCLICTGDLATSHGTHFAIEDRYSPIGNASIIQLQRSIRVVSPSPHDIGFTSKFAVRNKHNVSLDNYEVFVPGIWYRDNNNLPTAALASDLADDTFIFEKIAFLCRWLCFTRKNVWLYTCPDA